MLERIRNAAKWIGITIAGIAETAFTGSSSITASAGTQDPPDEPEDPDDEVSPAPSESL